MVSNSKICHIHCETHYEIVSLKEILKDQSTATCTGASSLTDMKSVSSIGNSCNMLKNSLTVAHMNRTDPAN